MKIALALSGGGFRATVFHLGVLARLAEDRQLENVTFLSTVSGGSLCAGLVHALNTFEWPASADYVEKILPEARRLLTTFDLEGALIFRVLGTFWTLFETRADDLSALMRQHWGITANLADLPEEPRWLINATCYETGKNWRFERFRMGDYAFGYSHATKNLPVSDALAASAGFPGLIGPLVLDATRHAWFQYSDRANTESLSAQHQLARQTTPSQPSFPVVHLWDGGAYDNLGLEGLYDLETGWRDKVEFLLVSDAAGRSKPERYQWGPQALLRLATGIMMDQVRSLRTRSILERLVNHGDPGVFLQIGNTARHVLNSAGKGSEVPVIGPACMSDAEAGLAENMATTIRKLTPEEFERLFRHGFEVADYTLFAYYPGQFKYIGYSQSRWGQSKP